MSVGRGGGDYQSKKYNIQTMPVQLSLKNIHTIHSDICDVKNQSYSNFQSTGSANVITQGLDEEEQAYPRHQRLLMNPWGGGVQVAIQKKKVLAGPLPSGDGGPAGYH